MLGSCAEGAAGLHTGLSAGYGQGFGFQTVIGILCGKSVVASYKVKKQKERKNNSLMHPS